MNQRSQSLQTRLDDIEDRLRSMRTVTNTASAEISGGETVIDVDGTLTFSDGGQLFLGSSSIQTADGRNIIDPEGNLTVDSLVVYGDILSARDYLYQREGINSDVIDTQVVESIYQEIEVGFPDWASSAMVSFDIYINTRVKSVSSNPLVVTLNGKPVSRPKSDQRGNISNNTSVVRRVSPDQPIMRIGVDFSEGTVPVGDPKIHVTIGGVFSV